MLIKNAYQAFTLEGVNLDLNIKQPLYPKLHKTSKHTEQRIKGNQF